MGKSLGVVQGITLGVALVTAGLYAVWEMASDRAPIPLADCLRSMQQAEGIREDRAVLLRSIKVDEDIYTRLADGRLSLVEAADALCEEIESRPLHLRQPIHPHERTIPRRELYMLRLLARVEEGLPDDPRRGEIVRRLRVQMRSYRAAPVPPVPTDASPDPAVVEAH